MQSIGSVARPLTAEVPAAPAVAPTGSNATAAPAPAQPGAQPPAAAPPTLAQLKAAIAAANQQLDQSNRELTFVFDDKLNRMLVKIIDTRTNTVIRQVPSEEMLAAARALSGTPARGTLIKSKA